MATKPRIPGDGRLNTFRLAADDRDERFEQAMGNTRSAVRRIFRDRPVYGLDVRATAWGISQAVADECLRVAADCRPVPDLDEVAHEVADACRLMVVSHCGRSAVGDEVVPVV